MPTEAEEMADLIDLISQRPQTPGTTDLATKRESATTASKYNRWLTGEQNRQAAETMRAETAALRQARAEEKEKYMQMGAKRKEERRELQAKHKAHKEQMQKDNLQTGASIKQHAAALKAVKQQQNLEHIEQGRAAVLRDEEQRRKIQNVKGEVFRNVAIATAQAKQDEIDIELALSRERGRVHAEKQAKVNAVRAETGDEILDQAKEFAYNQRKQLAAETNAAAAVAKDERRANEEMHLEKAKMNKAAAKASRAAAKQKREDIVALKEIEAKQSRVRQSVAAAASPMLQLTMQTPVPA